MATVWRRRWQLPFFVDPGCGEVAADPAGEPVGAEWCADGGEEQSFGVLVVGESWADEVEVEAEPEEGAFADRDVAVLGALAAADEDGAAVEVDVVDCEVDQFGSAKRAGVEDLEYGPVAETEWPREVRRGEQQRSSRCCSGSPRGAGGRAWASAGRSPG